LGLAILTSLVIASLTCMAFLLTCSEVVETAQGLRANATEFGQPASSGGFEASALYPGRP
jgi:hypothetical protein